MRVKRTGGPRRVGPTGNSEDRAVSDVIAFVLTFSVVITSVGVVSAVGFSVLQDVQSDEQALNAQRGFQTLGQNLNEIDRGHAPRRSGELSLSDGTLFTRTGSGGPTLNVTVGVPSGNRTFSTQVGRLIYRSQQERTRIALEAGAVFRRGKFADQGFAVQRPNFVCSSSGSNSYVVVSLVKIVSDESVRGGEGVIEISAEERSSTLLYSDSAADNVTVNYTGSDFQAAWQGYFERADGWSAGPDEATCDVGSGRVIVRRTVIQIDFV